MAVRRGDRRVEANHRASDGLAGVGVILWFGIDEFSTLLLVFFTSFLSMRFWLEKAEPEVES